MEAASLRVSPGCRLSRRLDGMPPASTSSARPPRGPPFPIPPQPSTPMPSTAPMPPAGTALRLPWCTLLVVLAAAALPRAAAHGFLSEPPSRNFLTNWRYCPHCLNGGGTAASSGGGTLVWPANSQPACGTPELAAAGAAVRRYAPGSRIDVKVFFSTQHGGRHAFRICPSPQADVACFEAAPLLQRCAAAAGGCGRQPPPACAAGVLPVHRQQPSKRSPATAHSLPNAMRYPPCTPLHRRADGGGPYSWTPVRGGPIPVPGVLYERLTRASLPGEEYTFRYTLPPGFTCQRCVLQVRGWAAGGAGAGPPVGAVQPQRAGCELRLGQAVMPAPGMAWHGSGAHAGSGCCPPLVASAMCAGHVAPPPLPPSAAVVVDHQQQLPRARPAGVRGGR